MREHSVMKGYTAILFFSLIVPVSPGFALTLSGGMTEVGEIDPFISGANLLNDGLEEAWAEGVLGFSLDLNLRNIFIGSLNSVEGHPDVFAHFFLSSDVDYFVLKTDYSVGGKQYFLFENISYLDYPVIDFSDLAYAPGDDIYSIAHISEYRQVPTGIGEPGIGMLFLIAGVLLGLYRRFTMLG